MSNRVNLTLDIMKASIKNPLITVRQGDGEFETLRATVTANGEPLDLQGFTITFMGNTAGKHKIVDGNVTIVEASKGIFEYTPSKAWGMDVGGFRIAYFKFVSGDGSTSSANFQVEVIEAVDLTQEEAQNYISVVDATISEIDKHLNDSLANVTQSIAETSSVASSLAVNVSSVASSAVNQINDTASSAAYNVNGVASNAVNNVNSTASNATNSITSSVTSLGKRVDDYNNKLVAVKVGGRNLLIGTWNGFTGIGNNSVNGNFDVQGGRYYLAGGKKVSDLYNQYGPSGYLTLSFDWVASGDTVSGQFNAQWAGQPYGLSNSGAIKLSSANTSGHYESTTPLTDGYSNGTATAVQFRQDNLQGNVTISNLKLEAGNVATDWSPAPEDADSTYFKNARRLPDDARDFAVIASDTIKYQGIWYTDGTAIANGPTNSWSWNTVEVLGGYGNGSGIIRTAGFGPNQEYVTTVNAAKMMGWKKVADDAQLVHNTGTATIAGDKTFTGNTNLSTTTILAGNYGLRVTASGIQKTTDGKNWTPANI